MFSFITNYLEPVACALYFLSLFAHYNAKKDKPAFILLVHYALATILLTLGAFRIGTVNNNNIWFYDLTALFTAIFIGWYFHRILYAPVKKKVVLFLISVYVVYSLVRNFSLEHMRLFDSMGYAIVSASIAIYVFMYFHQVLKHVNETSILKEFNFWLCSGYLIYFVGSFIVFVSYYYLTHRILITYTDEERDLLTALWGLHNVLLFISALSLLIGCLWINSHRKLVSS